MKRWRTLHSEPLQLRGGKALCGDSLTAESAATSWWPSEPCVSTDDERPCRRCADVFAAVFKGHASIHVHRSWLS